MVLATLIAAADSWTGSDGLDCTFCFLRDFLRLQSSLYYLTEATLFFHLFTFVSQISDHAESSNRAVRTGGEYVNSIIMSLFRAFGSTGIILPLVLGKEQTLLANMDFHVYLWIACITLYAVQKYVPNFYFWPISNHLQWFLYWAGNTCNGIFEVNALVLGFDLAAQGFPDSLGAAFVLSFMGVYGAHIVEKGFAGGFDDAYANEYMLAAFGTIFYKLLQDVCNIQAPNAQCVLVLLRVVQNRSDFRKMFARMLDGLRSFQKDIRRR